MPPRYSYWTIIAGGLPTAFRAAEREELLPTFTRLRQKQPDAELKWFARGRLWDSPADAKADTARRREASSVPAEKRAREWRPGGQHRDPRQKFKDAKKSRNQRWRAEKFERKRAAPPKREWNKPREGGPAPPKREWSKPREGGPAPPKREWSKPREGGWDAKPNRPFQRRGFERGQGTEEPPAPPRPRGPNREPRPSESPAPTPPPRPSEPSVPSPTPERGRKPFRPGGQKPRWNTPRDGEKRAWSPPGGGAPKRPWGKPRPDRPAAPGPPKRDWNEPREGGPPNRDWNKPRAWNKPREDGPAPPKRAWNKPREGGPAPPKRAWNKPREGGPRGDRRRR